MKKSKETAEYLRRAWHTAAKTPAPGRKVVLRGTGATGGLPVSTVMDFPRAEDWAHVQLMVTIERWAYLDDLLP